MAEMTFNSLEGKLYGNVMGHQFDMIAVSGGRGGSKQKGAGVDILQNNFMSSGVKLGRDASVGGTIPMGAYAMSAHEKKPNMIRLTPQGQSMFGRDGFLIHGRGERGSDGCIVPFDFQQLKSLLAAVKLHIAKFDTKPMLEVIVQGDVDYMIRKNERWANTA